MATIINDPYARGGGGVAGQQFGNLLSSGLQQLAQHKMNQLQQRHQAKSFQNIGLPESLSQGLARLSPDLQKIVLKNLSEQQGFGAPAQQEPQNYFAQEAMPQSMSQQPSVTQEAMAGMATQAPEIQNLMSSLNMTPQSPIDQMAQQALKSPVTQEARQLQEKPAQPEQAPKSFIEQSREKILSTRPTTKFQQSLFKEAKKQEIKQQHAEMKETSKENRKYIKEQYEAARESRENDMRLGRLEKLTRSEKLSRPRFYGFLDTLAHGILGHGINLKSLLSPETEEFDKVSKEMIKGAKSIFGSRITDNDLKQFMQMIPNASQSRDGKLRVIHQMRLFNEGHNVRKQAMDDIIRENKGVAPRDLKEMVEDRIKPQLDTIAQRYEAGLNEPQKKQQGYLERPQSYLPENPLDMILGRG